MIITVALDNKDGTAEIIGFEDRSAHGDFFPVEGYVYINNMYDSGTYYCVEENGVWKVKQRPIFNIEAQEMDAIAGEEMVFDIGVEGVDVYIDNKHMGTNEDTTVEFTPETEGTYILEFKKFPYRGIEVTVNATQS